MSGQHGPVTLLLSLTNKGAAAGLRHGVLTSGVVQSVVVKTDCRYECMNMFPLAAPDEAETSEL